MTHSSIIKTTLLARCLAIWFSFSRKLIFLLINTEITHLLFSYRTKATKAITGSKMSPLFLSCNCGSSSSTPAARSRPGAGAGSSSVPWRRPTTHSRRSSRPRAKGWPSRCVQSSWKSPTDKVDLSPTSRSTRTPSSRGWGPEAWVAQSGSQRWPRCVPPLIFWAQDRRE